MLSDSSDQSILRFSSLTAPSLTIPDRKRIAPDAVGGPRDNPNARRAAFALVSPRVPRPLTANGKACENAMGSHATKRSSFLPFRRFRAATELIDRSPLPVIGLPVSLRTLLQTKNLGRSVSRREEDDRRFNAVFRGGHGGDSGCCVTAAALLRSVSKQERDDGAGTTSSGSTQRVGDQCSMDDIVVYQGATGPLPSGIPTYTVSVLNLCSVSGGCSLGNIHLRCAAFSSARLINPRIFRRLSINDCLLNDGRPLAPGSVVSFQYANSFSYRLVISNATCAKEQS
ncbi:hypothetical protein ZIOFF_067685 [Zingiber officinale]|uniref:Uncharacterized protein n=1 Tax=Zingiber officinale TaxID=94328 RepID=A0A8J5CXF3_ZINOF|nr:hypothetical protein ZIOFF_067685 [Zingiber officinale]